MNPRLRTAALETAIGLTTIAYGHTSHASQVFIALFTFAVVIIDDFGLSADALHAFADRMRIRAPQMHPLLDRFAEVLDDAVNHFPAVSAREIVRGAMAFVDSMALECDIAGTPPLRRPGSFTYILAKRQANGIGRPYAHFVWDNANFPDFFGYMRAAP